MRREEYINGSGEETEAAALSLQSRMWTAMPGIVQKVTPDVMTCEVQPCIMGRIEDQNGEVQHVPLPVLLDVPLVFPRAGGWHVHCPVKEGDEVLIIFASRCIDAWWQNGGVQQAMEVRMHDLSDGFALPGIYSNSEAAKVQGGLDTKAFIIRDDAKENYIEITDEGALTVLHQKNLTWTAKGEKAAVTIEGDTTLLVKGKTDATLEQDCTLLIKGKADATIEGESTLTCKAAVTVTCDADVTASIQGSMKATVQGSTELQCRGSIKAQAQSIELTAQSVKIDSPQVEMTGNISVQGTASIQGAITGGGTITASGDMKGGGKSFLTHRHGNGNQGSPTTPPM